MQAHCQSRTTCPDTSGSRTHKPNFAKELAKPTQDKIGLKISQRFKKIKNNKRTETTPAPNISLAKMAGKRLRLNVFSKLEIRSSIEVYR